MSHLVDDGGDADVDVDGDGGDGDLDLIGLRRL